jgi:hypothetical protein
MTILKCNKKEQTLPIDKEDEQRMGIQPQCIACHANDDFEL